MLYILKIELLLLVSINKTKNLVNYFSLFLKEELNLSIDLYILTYINNDNIVL